MIVQCSECLRVRVNGNFRLPFPGEIKGEVAEVYCLRCARERLSRVQAGEFATDMAFPAAARKAANS